VLGCLMMKTTMAVVRMDEGSNLYCHRHHELIIIIIIVTQE
jgi:hypothetical protein